MTTNGREQKALLPESGHGKRRHASKSRLVLLMFAIILLQVLSSMGSGLNVLYVEIIRVFGTSRTVAALVQSTFTALVCIAGVLWTSVMSRLGVGLSIVLGSCIGAVGLLASAFVTNVYLIVLFTGVISGLGMSMTFLGSMVTAGWTFPKRRSAAVALSTAGASIGQFMYPTLNNALLKVYGMSGTFIILAGIALNGAVLGTLVHFSRRYMDTGVDAGGKKPDLFDMKLYKNLHFLLLLFVALLVGMFGQIENRFIVDLMMLRGFSRDTGSLFASLAGVANFCGRLFGTVLGLWGRIHLLINNTCAFALVALAHGLVLYFTDYAGLLASVIMFGSTYGITVSTLPGVYLEVLGIKHFPQAISSRNVSVGIGLFLNGLFGGFIKDVTGTYDLLFEIAVGAMVFTSISLFALFMKLRFITGKSEEALKGIIYARLEEDVTDYGSANGELYPNKNSFKKNYATFQNSCAF